MNFDDDEFIDINAIEHLYELRHACNVYDLKTVASTLKVSKPRIERLYNSNIHGSNYILDFIKSSDNEFNLNFVKLEKEAKEHLVSKYEALDKNQKLIEKLKFGRVNFAGLGTNKSKRRLNKLSVNNFIAKAVRIALEIEDKNISAKNSYGKYKDKIYDQKQKLILELCKLFKSQNWIYGIQNSNNYSASHVIYFEIPGCEQISWHFSPDKNYNFPEYLGKWDEKENSTMEKLEK